MSPGQEALKLKEIYAYIGYSIFLSQGLEGLLTQAIYAFVVFPENKMEIQSITTDDSLDQWVKFVDDQGEKLIERKMLGQLIGILRKRKLLDSEIERCLNDAVEQRNFLTHGFFKKHLPSLYTEQGQDEAINSLQISGGLIKKAMVIFGPIVKQEMERYGYDQDYMNEYAKNAIAKGSY